MKIVCTDRRPSYSIGYSIPGKLWDKDKERANPKKHPNASAINDRIKDIKDWIEEFTTGKNTVLADDLIAFLKTKDGKIKGQRSAVSFFEVITGKIDAVERGEIMNEGRPYSANTIKNWRGSLEKMREFEPYLSFDDTGEDVRGRFLAWSTRQGYALSYADRVIKDWRKFYELCGKTLDFKRLDSKEITSARTDVYLDEADILKMLELKLTGADELIRDRFIFNVEVGYRISDFKHIDSDNIDLESGTVDYSFQQKTKKKNASIDLTDRARAILAKYNGELPHQYHEVVVNRRIKEIAKAAGITEMIELLEREVPMRMREKLQLLKVYNLDPVKGTVKIPKCELISNHTARRSCITNRCAEDGTSSEIAWMLNIAEKTAARYNKLTPKEVAMKRAERKRVPVTAA
jgi:hypothetical protein